MHRLHRTHLFNFGAFCTSINQENNHDYDYSCRNYLLMKIVNLLMLHHSFHKSAELSEVMFN